MPTAKRARTVLVFGVMCRDATAIHGAFFYGTAAEMRRASLDSSERCGPHTVIELRGSWTPPAVKGAKPERFMGAGDEYAPATRTRKPRKETR